MADEIEIVLVEDNPGDAELTLRALGENKLANRVQLIRDGEEALDFIFCRGAYAGRSFLNPPKLILLDLGLPKLDGMQVLAVLKSDIRTQSVPVVVLTSSLRDRDILHSHQLGVNGYLEKPLDFEELREVLRQTGFGWLLTTQLSHAVGSNEEGKPVL